jgi:hypothetical protein
MRGLSIQALLYSSAFLSHDSFGVTGEQELARHDAVDGIGCLRVVVAIACFLFPQDAKGLLQLLYTSLELVRSAYHHGFLRVESSR